jgi:hypothetical protein
MKLKADLDVLGRKTTVPALTQTPVVRSADSYFANWPIPALMIVINTFRGWRTYEGAVVDYFKIIIMSCSLIGRT